MQGSILVLRNFRYLKITAALVIAAIVIYVAHTPLGQPNGGTWVGYTLGTVGALLIVWLACFGIRKRRYGMGKWTLQEWLSAHVYLGLGLIIIASLHAGFQFGWNVHTLAYVFMVIVILSGVYGLYLYLSLPNVMARNRGGLTLEEIMGSIAALDDDCGTLGVQLGDEVNDLVHQAAENSRVGGSPWMQLSGKDPQCPTARALERVRELLRDADVEDATTGRQLVLMLARKNELLLTARRDVQYRAWLDIWLLLHIPMTVGLLVALSAHVISVFFYW